MDEQSQKDIQPKMTIKNGFYKAYQLEREATPKQAISIFRLDQARKEWLIRWGKRIGKGAYYAMLFFLCSIGLSALLNASIRQLLLQSFFGS